MMSPARIPRDTGLRLALRRVHVGTVKAFGPDSFSYNGRPFLRALVPFLSELFDHGQVRLEERAEDAGPRRVLITESGQALLAELESTRDHGELSQR